MPENTQKTQPNGSNTFKVVLKKIFHHIAVDSHELSILQKPAPEVHRVYVMECDTLIDRLILRFVMPQKQFDALRILSTQNFIRQWLFSFLQKMGFSPKKESRWTLGGSSLIFIRTPKSLLFRGQLTEKAQSHTLSEIFFTASRIENPVSFQFIPITIAMGKKTEKLDHTFFDFLLGNANAPGNIRRLIYFLANRKSVSIKIGKAVAFSELSQFQAIDIAVSEPSKFKTALENLVGSQKRSIQGTTLVSKNILFENILNGPLFLEDIKALAASTQAKEADLLRKAKDYLKGIAADFDGGWAGMLYNLFSWVWKRIYGEISCNEEAFQTIRNSMKDSSIIFVPNHKSHIDYLILSYLFYERDIQLPFIAAGKNLDFWPLSHLFRRAGAFYIKRTIKGNPLYALTLKAYLRALYENGNPLELFLEGTRTRTGKLISPKIGLMSMLVENAIFSSSHYDLKFIPVSLNYEKIVEEKAMMREQRGLKKKPESLWGIVKAFRSLKYRYGNVYIRFGEPLSIKEWLGKDEILSLREEGRSQFGRVSKVAKDLAHELMLRIAKEVTVTGSSLIAVAMLSNQLRGMAESRLLKRIDFLMDFLVHEKAPLAKNSVHMARLVAESLSILIKSGIISKYNDGTGSIYAIADKKRVHLDYYKNGIIQYFAAPSAIMLILRRFGNLSLDDVIYHFEKLGTILKGEFFFVNFSRDRVEETLNTLRKLGVVQIEEEYYKVAGDENADMASMFEGILRNYIEGYYIVSGKLAELNGRFKALKEEAVKKVDGISPLSTSSRILNGNIKIPITEEGRRLYYLGEVKNLESTSESLFASAASHIFSEENTMEAKIQRDYLKSLL